MNNSLRSGSLKVATIMGIPIRVHYSWLIIFGLLTWSLSVFYFPKVAPRLPGVSYWVSGTAAALLLFFSVAFHELSHSFVARRYGIAIHSITLFIFGGVAQMRAEPKTPRAEVSMALAGPLSSFGLSAFFYLAESVFSLEPLRALFQYLSRLNLVLGAFNLIPGFPMDGGRVVRALMWQRTGDYFSATKRAAGYGQNIALAFIVIGLLSIFTGFPGGIWLMLVGWFLYTAAQSSFQQASFQETLRGVKVSAIMIRDLVTIGPAVTVRELVDDFFLRLGFGGFPVVEGGRFLGFVTLKECTDVPKEKWGSATVRDVFVPHEKRWEVSEKEDAIKALDIMLTEDKGRLAVTSGDGLIGMITRNGIARYVRTAHEVGR